MRRKLVLGNWKMNGSRAEATAWAHAAAALSRVTGAADVGVIPAFVHLDQVQQACRSAPLWLGAQDVAAFENGAHTGEVRRGRGRRRPWTSGLRRGAPIAEPVYFRAQLRDLPRRVDAVNDGGDPNKVLANAPEPAPNFNKPLRTA
mgnify:CR=1 FL=1